ncbi:MAG: hypothetical protein CL908_18010 [Deltaproteobacteria bacterium]|nr:hypothetical protein [Deltaproteobacteria bacterium]
MVGAFVSVEPERRGSDRSALDEVRATRGWPEAADRATLASMNRALERALLVRPLALGVGGVAAVWFSSALRDGPLVAWVVAIFGGLGLVLWLVRDARFVRRPVLLASPVVSLLGWGALALFTQGLESPFLAAFFVEIALAAVSMGPMGVLWVSGNAIAVLFAIYALFGFDVGGQLMILETGFLVVIGGLASAVAARRVASERALRTQGDELGQRLEALQRELEDERVISRVGENVARLAHGLKNAVHSLRGFVGLIEPQLEGGAGSNAALLGLRTAIDELEKLARLALAEKDSAAPDAGREQAAAEIATRLCARPAQVIEEARREITRASPAVAWQIRSDANSDAVVLPIGATTFLELLIILMRNAVEAMHGEGSGRIEMASDGELYRLAVIDEGEGLGPEVLSQIFQPGYTTKAEGSGFGLFLARRIVEDYGGSLELLPGAEKGAVVQVELPVVRSSEGGQTPRAED